MKKKKKKNKLYVQCLLKREQFVSLFTRKDTAIQIKNLSIFGDYKEWLIPEGKSVNIYFPYCEKDHSLSVGLIALVVYGPLVLRHGNDMYIGDRMRLEELRSGDFSMAVTVWTETENDALYRLFDK